MIGLTPKERASLEARAAKFGRGFPLKTVEAMALFLHRETGKSLSICRVWAGFIKIKSVVKG